MIIGIFLQIFTL